MFAAAAALGRMQEIPPDVGLLFWGLLRRFGSDFGSIDKDGESLDELLAATFGRTCGDPSPHAVTLVGMLAATFGRTHVSYLAAIAGVEVALRCRDYVPSNLKKKLVDWAALHASAAITHDPKARVCGVRLLGLLGGEEHIGALQQVMNLHPDDSEVAAVVAEALELLGPPGKRMRTEDNDGAAVKTSDKD